MLFEIAKTIEVSENVNCNSFNLECKDVLHLHRQLYKRVRLCGYLSTFDDFMILC